MVKPNPPVISCASQRAVSCTLGPRARQLVRAQAYAQVDGRVALAEPRYQAGRVDQASVFAAAANRDQRHFSTRKFTQSASFPALPSIPAALRGTPWPGEHALMRCALRSRGCIGQTTCERLVMNRTVVMRAAMGS